MTELNASVPTTPIEVKELTCVQNFEPGYGIDNLITRLAGEGHVMRSAPFPANYGVHPCDLVWEHSDTKKNAYTISPQEYAWIVGQSTSVTRGMGSEDTLAVSVGRLLKNEQLLLQVQQRKLCCGVCLYTSDMEYSSAESAELKLFKDDHLARKIMLLLQTPARI